MKKCYAFLLSLALFVGFVTTSQAQDKELTLCWAAWDPANALRELSKDFTAKSGINMNFEFVPWTNFADRFLNELNSGGRGNYAWVSPDGRRVYWEGRAPSGDAATMWHG